MRPGLSEALVTSAGAFVSLASAIVGGAFAVLVFRRFWTKRRPHDLLWAVGLAMFAAVAGVQTVAEFTVWSAGVFKAWYFLGASLVGFLGGGSVYLAHRTAGQAFVAYLLILATAFAVIVARTPTLPAGLNAFNAGVHDASAVWGSGALVRLFSPCFTVPGSLALIGVALFGLVRHRAWSNGLIAGGAAVLAVGTGLGRFGVPAYIYVAELAGIALMFAGFLRTAEWARRKAAGAKKTSKTNRKVEEEELVEDEK